MKDKVRQIERVCVLFGGISPEHDISVKSALFALKSLIQAGFESSGYYIDRQNRPADLDSLIKKVGALIEEGILPQGAYSDILTEELICKKPPDIGKLFNILISGPYDIVFPVFHGPGGEDGSIQGALEFLNIPYIGSGIAGSAMAMDKAVTKTMCEAHGIKILEYLSFSISEWKKENKDYLRRIEGEIGYPCFIKPARLGSSIGISRADNRDDLISAVNNAAGYDSKLICERAISGREYSVAVIGNLYPEVSVPAEISLWNNFFDYPAKYGPEAIDDIIPAPLSPEFTGKLQQTALKVYKILGLSGMARVDSFIEDGQVYVNEANTIPGLGGNSLFHRMWEETGVPVPELFKRLISYALE